MNKTGHTNVPTAQFIKSMREVASTLNSSSTSLLSVAVRMAEIGHDDEAQLLIDLVKGLHRAEEEVRRHSKDAGVGRIVKLSEH
ncbi:hypothetical protein [Pseudomonas sp. NA-150]|uniref:hypothetical protein n=1 Tax=Pseudomonas sp. NA-150 TaxID=3367525 RepID=UPI0037C627B5